MVKCFNSITQHRYINIIVQGVQTGDLPHCYKSKPEEVYHNPKYDLQNSKRTEKIPISKYVGLWNREKLQHIVVSLSTPISYTGAHLYTICKGQWTYKLFTYSCVNFFSPPINVELVYIVDSQFKKVLRFPFCFMYWQIAYKKSFKQEFIVLYERSLMVNLIIHTFWPLVLFVSPFQQ